MLAIVWLSAMAIYAQYFRDKQPACTKPVETWSYTYYAVGFSNDTHTPLWSAMETKKVINPNTGCPRISNFASDSRENPKITHNDYSNTGYSRGHMTPNAIVAYAFGCDANKTTFMTSNIVPQLQDHNGGVWEALESVVGGVNGSGGFKQGLVNRVPEAWIYTGPVFWGSNIEKTGPKGIWVPTAIWKTVIWKTIDGKTKTCSWMIPHEAGIPKNSYMDYTVSIKDIAAKTGVNILGSTADPLYSEIDIQDFLETID